MKSCDILSCGINIRRVEKSDGEFWFSLDKHIPKAEFEKKVRDGRGYVAFAGGQPAGILRYNLLWDEVPFCTLLYISRKYRGKGCGGALLRHWENDMRGLGYGQVMTSTRSDEDAQHFYRALGYVDCGGLDVPNQPRELFLIKRL